MADVFFSLEIITDGSIFLFAVITILGHLKV